ncbi:MAG: hypothetical protein KKE20_01480, partial [Nanoarchaeota archaeon]|nr:hypothetical protein [Nanoarchaeota archaeon]
MEITKMIKLKNYSVGDGTDEILIEINMFSLVQTGEYDTSRPWGEQIGAEKPFQIKKNGWLGIELKYPEKKEIKKGDPAEIRCDIKIPNFEKPPLKILVLKITITPIFKEAVIGQGFNETAIEQEKKEFWEIVDLTKEFELMKSQIEKASTELNKIKEDYNTIDQALRNPSIAPPQKARIVNFLSDLITGKRNKQIADLLKTIHDELKYSEERLKMLNMEGALNPGYMQSHLDIKQRLDSVMKKEQELSKIVFDNVDAELNKINELELEADNEVSKEFRGMP